MAGDRAQELKFLAPTSGCSQMSITSAMGNSTLPPGRQQPHTGVHPHKHTHTEITVSVLGTRAK